MKKLKLLKNGNGKNVYYLIFIGNWGENVIFKLIINDWSFINK